MIANRLWVGCGWVWGENEWGGNEWGGLGIGGIGCSVVVVHVKNSMNLRHYDPKLSDISEHSVVL